MKSFDTNAFQRLGGASSRRLSQDPGQELLESTATVSLTPSQLTTQFFNDLQGNWFGNKGWNIIALPSRGSTPQSQGDFKLLVIPYAETLDVRDAGAPARNRGGSVDQFVAALEYQQRVFNKDTAEALHVENGMFMNLSAIVDNNNQMQPPPGFNVARSGTIPHGDSIMLLSKPPFVEQGAPNIPDISSLPPDIGQGAPLGYTDPYLLPNKDINVGNPNATLRQDLETQAAEGFEILETKTLVLDSSHSGGISNIPFIVHHANATRMQAVFWLEKVRNTKTGQEFDQLQYTQIIDLVFHLKFGQTDPKELITWPHITINTMVKQ
uniref:heme-binding protein n=1 Tax=Marinobacterium profundum TaxID=1714300 RepID=UPI0008377511|nr:heme-binding protein [Marinobacterium profundum]